MAGIAHHWGSTGKGIGQKCTDFETVPFCANHHIECHTIGSKRFQERYHIEFEKISSSYNWKYARSHN